MPAFDFRIKVDKHLTRFNKFVLFQDNLPSCSFTFWKWVFACLNLIRMRLKMEWKDGYAQEYFALE